MPPVIAALFDNPVLTAVSFAYGVLLAGPLIGWTNYLLRGRASRGGKWFTAQMGVVERVILWAAIAAGAWEVLGAWLLFKVASRWGAWGNRAGVWNTFALGVGLEILYVTASIWFLGAHNAGRADVAVTLLGGPLALNAFVLLLALGPVRLRRIFDPEAGREGEERNAGPARVRLEDGGELVVRVVPRTPGLDEPSANVESARELAPETTDD